MDPAVQTTLRLGLALLFLWGAHHKARNRAGFRGALAQYRILPKRWVSPAAALIVAAECGIAAALLVPGLGPAPALAAAALLASYSGAISVNLFRGRRAIDCGCAGPAGPRAISEGLVARNAVLILLAALSALPIQARALVWFDAFTVGAGVSALALLYAAVDVGMANALRLRRLGDEA
jgi:hypothetical protein